ncbi:hypothetical protein SAMD00019534_124200 [Acytostelium subglobosum LB1]|uniref:hypothetical protein n=1 Tax=Acytostelium subglobosum LB1 TaxID=1410327 RepID=UPI000645097F|nr:hypothetical protein SAMD00019534_124200 [Acytostelium subglobosum LB1]GAM29244.1 hypothetical protein SAMD00019534_124200 [Acytostelium subglobosum LB1]|eukprot:XP_012747818.1 hypothetical protein SAMD00019534_124200 [Acytostelium subglobosum LB1]
MGIGGHDSTLQKSISDLIQTLVTLNQGVHQVFFVIKDRFSDVEQIAFRLLTSVIFKEEVLQYVTIVCTNSKIFNNPAKVEQELSALNKDNKIGPIIKSCNKILFVDNPPINDDDDEHSQANAQKKRLRSREIMLDHLNKCDTLYVPTLNTWETIKRRIECLKGDYPMLSYLIDAVFHLLLALLFSKLGAGLGILGVMLNRAFSRR